VTVSTGLSLRAPPRDAHNRFDAPARKVDGPPIQTQCLSIQDQEAIGSSPISLVGSSRRLELEDAMKPSGRLLHRRQGVQRTERDLLSVLIAEGSLSKDWLRCTASHGLRAPNQRSSSRTSKSRGVEREETERRAEELTTRV
jgi:hypothetical protein